MKNLTTIILMCISLSAGAQVASETESSKVIEQIQANDPNIHGDRTKGAAAMLKLEDNVLPAVQVTEETYDK